MAMDTPMKTLAAVASRITFDRVIRLAWLLLAVYAVGQIDDLPKRFGNEMPRMVSVKLCSGSGVYGACDDPIRVQVEH